MTQSGDQVTLFTWITYAGLCQIINVFGVFSNIINIMCFVKQGFKEAINVSLLGLAISDLACLLTQFWMNVYLTPSVTAAATHFDVIGVMFLTAGMPHLTFTRVTSWITAFITLERCLCIIAPLQVKNLFTPRITAIIILCVYIILMTSAAPVYFVNRLEMKYFPERNRTLFGLVFTADRDYVQKITFIISNFVMPFSAFLLVIICTAMLVTSLQKNSLWHRSSASSLTAAANRNQRVGKMVVMISALFIACFIPTSIIMLAVAFEPELTVGGKYISVGFYLGGLGMLLESINSSVNIFIYYHMGSRFRGAFVTIFCKPFAGKK